MSYHFTLYILILLYCSIVAFLIGFAWSLALGGTVLTGIGHALIGGVILSIIMFVFSKISSANGTRSIKEVMEVNGRYLSLLTWAGLITAGVAYMIRSYF